MTVAAVVLVALAGDGLLLYVIHHLLADNRRLTAAALAPKPEQAARIIQRPASPPRVRDQDDERPAPTPLIGA